MFETYLVQKQPRGRRYALIASSVGLHILLAVGLILYSFFHVNEVSPPELTVTFFAAPPPPPPPPPPAASAKPSRPKITRPVHAPVLTQPVPDQAPTPTPEEPADSAPDEPAGEPGGVPGGVAGGVPGGVVGGVPSPAPPPAKAAPKMVPSFVFDRERISAPDPHLSSEFLGRHAKQTVTGSYRICVGTDGRVTEMAPIRGILGADEDLIRQVSSTWSWKPQPLPVCTIRNFVFKIN